MKKLVTLFAGVVLLALLTTAACAQAAGPTGGGVQATGAQNKGAGKSNGPIGAKILKQLDLTPDQQKQIKELVASFQQKRQQAQQAKNRKELAGLRRQFLQDLNNILTPAQQAKLRQLIQERNKKTGATGGGKAGTGATGGSGTGTATGGGKTGGF
ncbi:MAG: Spy/CpxP family protein refolding chaperone [Fimbriimonadales bacterium]